MNSDQPYRAPTAILETVVYCEDLVAADHFYQTILGLRLWSEESERHRFYRLGQCMLLVFNPSETRTSTVHVGDQWIPQHGAVGPGHVAFRVDGTDFDSIRARLDRHEIEIESEIDWPGGGHSIYCRDPAGNSVEFATRSLWFQSTE